ncbi:uncharacterized protein IL334_004578 [Kwoniella shivajii]|uniref:MutL C-terminal dimerisation domain-containing protein n=1 Tax=Kwoniella shivajii TaxID=564305 RepID=A0ABZ1D142_9TREE|nr:hypothetical protein IL334_004578 [Kwoniella shivajii]
MDRITPLPTPTTTTIRSSLIIPTFPQILSELVQNSLDANARYIDIALCLTKGEESMRVEDDGCGITQAGLRKIGKRFRTSKTLNESNLGSVDSYGYRGEALSSISALSLFTITTRPTSSETSYTKIVKSSKTLYMGIDPSRIVSLSSGTIINVKEIFHNIPVRREELSSMNGETLIRQCKKIIEVLALCRPGIGWTVWEQKDTGGRKLLLGIRSAKSSVHIFRSLYGNALVQRVQNIRVSAGTKRVDGFISLSGDFTKIHQHLYINNYPLARSDLHLAISKKFSDSRFSTYASAGDNDLEYIAGGQRRSPRRMERHPIYVLNVSMPSDEVDVSYEPQKGMLGYKDYSKVRNLILAVVDEFLKKNGFGTASTKCASLSPTKQASTCIGLHGKSPLGKDVIAPFAPSGNEWDLTRPSPLSFTVEHPSSSPILPLVLDTILPSADVSMSSATKHSLQSSRGDLRCPAIPAIPSQAFINQRRDLPTTHVNYSLIISEKPVRKSQWITDLETTLDLGVLPIACGLKRNLDILQGDNQCGSCPTEGLHSSFARPINPEPRTRMSTLDIQLTRSSLSKSYIIGQVDKKFVSVILPTPKGERALVLIDQHAADERISIENILSSLSAGFRNDNIPTTRLEIPINIVLTSSEARTLSSPENLDIFRRWGIQLSLPDLNDIQGDYVQIGVSKIPSLLSSRLGRKEGTEMIRLIRGYIPSLEADMDEIKAWIRSFANDEIAEEEEDMGEHVGKVNDGAGEDCIGRDQEVAEDPIPHEDEGIGKDIRFMPREMLELANSKACRGAIMFQDPLNRDQQIRLTTQLSDTKFPFICAHGRPSMIPLIALKGPTGMAKKLSKRDIDWSNWKHKVKGS